MTLQQVERGPPVVGQAFRLGAERPLFSALMPDGLPKNVTITSKWAEHGPLRWEWEHSVEACIAAEWEDTHDFMWRSLLRTTGS